MLAGIQTEEEIKKQMLKRLPYRPDGEEHFYMEELHYKKLRGRIIEKYGTQEKFGEEIGISKTSLSKKMTGKSGFSQKDIIRWCELLDIDLKNVGEFFYA